MGKFRGLKSRWAKLYFVSRSGESDSASPIHAHECTRCGVVIPLSVDSVTKRLDYTPCIRHLVGETVPDLKRPREDEENEQTAGGDTDEKLATPSHGFDLCKAGRLTYDAEAAWYAVRDAESKNKPINDPSVGSESKQSGEEAYRDCAEKLIDLARAARLSSDLASRPPASVVGLLNPKTPANYGAILRACGCFARMLPNSSSHIYDSAVIYSDGRLQRAMEFQEEAFTREVTLSGGNRAQKGAGVANTDTMAAGLRIPQWHLQRLLDFGHLIDAVRTRLREINESSASNSGRRFNVVFVAVDLIEGAVSLPHFKHYMDVHPTPDVIVYLFGPEDGSIPTAIVSKCDRAVYINTDGSLNLSATVNVLLYDRLCKWEQHAQSSAEADSHHSSNRNHDNSVGVHRNSNNKTRV